MIFSKDSVDQFISQLSIVKYHTGSMGTFFLNFLMADHPLIEKLVQTKLFGRSVSSEWLSFCYSNSILSDIAHQHYRELLPEAKNFNELIYFLALIYRHALDEIFQSKEKFYTGGSVEEFINRAFPVLKDRALQDSRPIQVELPYVKCHVSGDDIDNLYDRLNVKEKIYCFFPKTKQWIPYVLTMHKHIVMSFNRKSDLSLNYMMHLLQDRNMDIKFNVEVYQPDYYNVDMYQLILTDSENSVNQLQENLIDFNLTDKKMSLLTTARRDINSTLAFYGLDPNLEFDLDQDFNSFIKSAPIFMAKIKASEAKFKLWTI